MSVQELLSKINTLTENNYLLETTMKNNKNANANTIDKYGKINCSCISEDLMKRLHNNCHTKAMKLL